MTLDLLAQEYRTSAALLAGRLAELRRMQHTAPAGIGGAMQRYRLCRRIELLSSMLRETQATARYLEQYYERTCSHGRRV